MAEIEPTHPVVCDAGPLIHLDELGSLDLLADFHLVVVPEPVWSEVERHRPDAFGDVPPTFERRPVGPATDARFLALFQAFSLSAGEQAALSCPELAHGGILLTDDAAARTAAAVIGYRVHGTLGVLLRAIRSRRRTRTQVLDVLRSIPTASTLHLRRTVLERVIGEVEALPE